MAKFGALSALILTLAIAQGGLAAEFQSYEAVYSSKLKGFNVRVKRRLQVQGDSMIISVDVKKLWFGLHESSALQLHDDGRLYPGTYVHKRRGTSHEHDKDLVFDWNENSVIDLLEPGREPLPVEKPSYDKLSYQTQMRLDLARDPNLKHIEYSVTNGVRNRIYSFDRLSEEVLDTRLGKLNTIKFERKGDDDDRQVFVWVAPDWDFLLVRIDQIKDRRGNTERLMLVRATIAGQNVEGLPQRLSNNAAPVQFP